MARWSQAFERRPPEKSDICEPVALDILMGAGGASTSKKATFANRLHLTRRAGAGVAPLWVLLGLDSGTGAEGVQVVGEWIFFVTSCFCLVFGL